MVAKVVGGANCKSVQGKLRLTIRASIRGFCGCYLVAMTEGALLGAVDNRFQSVVKRFSTTNGHYRFSI